MDSMDEHTPEFLLAEIDAITPRAVLCTVCGAYRNMLLWHGMGRLSMTTGQLIRREMDFRQHPTPFELKDDSGYQEWRDGLNDDKRVRSVTYDRWEWRQ